jgi:hypothetical protein
MRHTNRKRSEPDPLQPIGERSWLVVRDMLSRILDARELAPWADLHGTLTAARSARIAQGWNVGDIGSRCAFFFADRSGERVMVTIECREPWRQVRGI